MGDAISSKTILIICLICGGAFFALTSLWKSHSYDQPNQSIQAIQSVNPDHAIHVQCTTTKGPLEIVVAPDWSPRGAERFLQLVDDGFFNGLPFFRCIEGFVCQFGSAPPRTNVKSNAKSYSAIPDDPQLPHLRTFKRGYVSFAGFGPDSRSTHAFIALGESVASLGTQPWETPIGYVTEASMQSTVSQITTIYGDTSPAGSGPEPQKIETAGGAEYLKRNFPMLDSFVSCARAKPQY